MAAEYDPVREIQQAIARVEAAIVRVDEKIEAVEKAVDAAVAAKDEGEISRLAKREEQLRTEKEQLRTEKEQLRERLGKLEDDARAEKRAAEGPIEVTLAAETLRALAVNVARMQLAESSVSIARAKSALVEECMNNVNVESFRFVDISECMELKREPPWTPMHWHDGKEDSEGNRAAYMDFVRSYVSPLPHDYDAHDTNALSTPASPYFNAGPLDWEIFDRQHKGSPDVTIGKTGSKADAAVLFELKKDVIHRNQVAQSKQFRLSALHQHLVFKAPPLAIFTDLAGGARLLFFEVDESRTAEVRARSPGSPPLFRRMEVELAGDNMRLLPSLVCSFLEVLLWTYEAMGREEAIARLFIPEGKDASPCHAVFARAVNLYVFRERRGGLTSEAMMAHNSKSSPSKSL